MPLSVSAGSAPLTGTPDSLLAALRSALPGPHQVRHRPVDRLAMANDASHYLLTPQAVVAPAGAAEVARLLRASAAQGVPLTFRSGGTSLSGQGVTDGVLVDVRRHLREVEVLDDGLRVRVQPGATVRQVNTRLARHGRKLGPDPASESACTIGGVVANNSSGMACGIRDNAYRTIESLVLVLPSGTVIDTGAADADQRLRTLEPELYAGLARLRDRVRDNPASVRTIQRQFAMKNTMGYGLNAFLDHTAPVDLLTHLVIGSEGTLAFVAEATFRTVPVLPHAATGLLVFDQLAAATAALPALVDTAPATIELLDAAALRVAQGDPQADELLRRIAVRQHAALLVEYQAPAAQALAELVAASRTVLDSLPLAAAAELTGDPRIRARLWHVRKGLYAAVAGARPSGTSALLEDIVVPVPELLPTCATLTGLFDRHGYRDSVIFGHAKDGNIHFMLTERFDDRSSLDRYHEFTEEMVDLVLARGGSLKAEHGTGRMMAPYVRRQYGDELYDVMRELKRLCDPNELLNPGVILTGDERAHLRHLKSTPTVEPEVDRCVECGYCEPVCPSRDLTTTPRQRIVLRRARAAADAAGDSDLVGEIDRAYRYDGVQTCAVDGMCQTACPVLINTGDLVRRLRTESAGRTVRGVWRGAARHWNLTTRAAAGALDLAGTVPAPVAEGASRLARRMAGDEQVPLWSRDLPRGGDRRQRSVPSTPASPTVVLFPACIGAVFAPGNDRSGPGVGPALRQLCQRAGIEVTSPAGLSDLCCGTPWKSKGFTDGYRVMERKVLPALWAATDGGTLPVVCDGASCTEGLTEMVQAGTATHPEYAALRVVDAVELVAAEVLPRLPRARRLSSLALHPTCASNRLGLDVALRTVAAAVADEVVVPDEWGCCAFAGDRGLLHPELTAAATARPAAQVRGRDFAGYASCNRTCEIGMTRATGRPYRHVIELLEELTRPDADPPEGSPRG